MISVQGISKRYGRQILFEAVTFSLCRGERAGLVGRNGCGKSTLFRIIVGEEEPDTGSVVLPRGYRIGYLSQNVSFSAETVLGEVAMGLPEMEKNAVWKAEQILMGVGFAIDDFTRTPSEFSGGYQMRIMLAKTLVAHPDLLLLDEPTNFLDIVSIRWLERFLVAWPGELIVITHDQRFMDRVITATMGIHRHSVRKYAGTTSQYYGQIAAEETVYEKKRINQEKKTRQMNEFIARFRAKARQASLAQSRIKTLAKIQPKEKLRSIETLSFSFPLAAVPPKTMMRAENLSFSYTGCKPYLIDNLSFAVDVGSCICVVGKNGRGKTTLIKTLVNALAPCEGVVKTHPQCCVGYYEQGNTALLNPANSVEEEVMSAAEPGDAQLVRTVCGTMLFSGDAAEKKIRVLSGGEKCRVLLAKLLVSRHNLLVLDEPTHHLDMESCDAIIDAVQRFEGAAIIVTHDERFLEEVATELIVFKQDGIQHFPGTYTEFLEQVGWDDETSGSPGVAQEGGKRKATKEERRKRSLFLRQRSEAYKPYEIKIAEIEAAIAERESELRNRTQLLITMSEKGDAAGIQEHAKEVRVLEKTVNELYHALEAVLQAYEEKQQEFNG